MAYQPKSYKKFVATAATATLVASAIAPVASAAFSDVAEQYKTAVDYLSTKGISQGYPNGKFGTDDKIKRQDAAVMIAKALGASPTGTYANAGFTDVPKDRQWAVNFLVEKKIVSGKTAEKFGANDFTTRGEMSKIIANAYKFVGDATNTFPFTDVSDTFKQYVDALNEAGVAKGLTATKFGTGENVTRGQFALFVYRAETFVPAAPSVVSVSAINAKEIEINFNQAMDAVTAEDESNYSLLVAGATEANFTAVVDEDDAKKVVLTLTDAAKLANNEAVQLTVKKSVLSKSLVAAAADYAKTWVFSDTTATTITSVERNGNDLEVTFDDYVSALDLAKVDGVDKTSNVVAIAGLTKTITITGGATGLAAGSHSVLVSGVTDSAGNKSSVLNSTVTISSDTTAPSVSKVVQSADNTVKVTFDKVVTLVGTGNFQVKKNGYDLGVAVATTDNKTFTLTLSNVPPVTVYDAGVDTSNVTLVVSGFKATANNIVGNVYSSALTLSKDKVAPTVVSRFNTITNTGTAPAVNEFFDIHFDEVITLVGTTGQVTLTDKNGVRQNVTGATVVPNAAGDNKVLRIDSTNVKTSGAINAGAYNINLPAGFVKDASNNSSAAANVAITKSASAATVTATATAAVNVIAVEFTGTPMTTSATTLANYQLDGKALPAGTNIYFDGDTESVKIELPAGSVKSSGGAVLTLSDSVVSTTGSKVSAATKTINISTGFVDNVLPTLVSAKKASATTVELTFDEVLDDATVAALANDDFVVKVNGVTFAYTATTDVAGDNKLVLTTALYNTAQAVTVSVTTDSALASVKDVAGNTIKLGTAVTAN
ncbi:S-layer homology domain-containing protein [Paenisporosarcina sp. FSL H8-0542]|uniref:S-layer homology domain-containing protein n=1 Tax=Paenisporosarcina sp. FSL H8-0542 TaxID=2921401 RepID=UPI003159AF8C